MASDRLLRKVPDLIGFRDIDDMGRNSLRASSGDLGGDRQQACLVAIASAFASSSADLPRVSTNQTALRCCSATAASKGRYRCC